MTTDEARRERELRAQEQRAALIEQGDRIDDRLLGIEQRMDARRDRERTADEERRAAASKSRRRRRRRDIAVLAVIVAAIALFQWRSSRLSDCMNSWATAQQARAEAVGAAFQAERVATKARDAAATRRDQVFTDALLHPPATEADRSTLTKKFTDAQVALSRANAELDVAHQAYDTAQERLSIRSVGAKLNC